MIDSPARSRRSH